MICRRALAALVVTSGAGVHANSDYGLEGLFDVPTARMRNEGELTVTLSGQEIADMYTVSYQATPWAEAAFRYSIFNPRRLDRSTDEQKDRSFALKVRLLEENDWRPQVAAGARDLLGTGIWGGEYLVATKRFGPVDLTLGMGWGRLAQRSAFANPLAELGIASRGERSRTVEGGTFSISNYFSGRDVGVFGGVEYELPWNMRFLAEYNTDRYARERRLGTIDDVSPYSLGLEWEPYDDLVLSASWQHGNQVGLRISATVDGGSDPAIKRPNGFGEAGRRPVAHRSLSAKTNWYVRFVSDAEVSGVLIRSADDVSEDTLAVVYTNQSYQLEADAIRRVLTLAELYAPRTYRRLVLVSEEADVPTHSVHYLRRGRVAWAADAEIGDAARGVRVLPPLAVGDPRFVTRYRYPNFAPSIDLGLRTYLFDPDRPFRYQFFARFGVEADFGGGWGASAAWVQDIYNQFDGISRNSDSVLPRVRSDVSRYLREGETGIDRLVVTKRGRLARDVYYQGFAGILEEMYGGAGAEVLYRPFGSRFAVGANLIFAQQRDFDRSFRFRDFETVTGHLSVYWATPFYGFDVKVHAGRYLARDWGATLEVVKVLPNGWSVGAFATRTDVSARDFGEGSFDKGLILRVPFDALAGFNTRAAYTTLIRPLQRDGGQRIESWGTSLWDTHRATSFDHLHRTKGRMLPR